MIIPFLHTPPNTEQYICDIYFASIDITDYWSSYFNFFSFCFLELDMHIMLVKA